MVADECIGDIYRIQGLTRIGGPKVFPKSRIAKKKNKPREEEETPGKTKEEKMSPSVKGIDIEA